MEFSANATVKINNEERKLWVSIKGDYHINYQIETNLIGEDAAKAERHLKSAIKSGRTMFKVPTTARVERSSVYLWWKAVKVWDNGDLIEDEEASELLKDAMNGKVTDLGDYEVLRDLVPMPKDERIEFICEVPEELLISNNASKQKFHIEDWINYYKVELDEEDLIDSFDSEDLSKVTSIYFDGETLSVDLESNVSDLVYVTRADDETGEEEEHEVEIFADFSYSVDYKIDDLEKRLEDFNEALNEAINKEETTFEIRVPFVAGEAFDLDVDVTEIYNDEVDEDDVRQAAYESIECGLASASFEMHHGDSVQPPCDKEILLICTIPTEE